MGVSVVEVAWGMGLSVGGGGVDVSEGADLGGGRDDSVHLGGEGLDGGFVTGFPRFVESSEKTSQTVSHFFLVSTAICFWSAWKREIVNVV